MDLPFVVTDPRCRRHGDVFGVMSAAVSCSVGVAEPGRLDTLRRPRRGRFQ
jgi:hypothetical protein